jgi:hypothetical protein
MDSQTTIEDYIVFLEDLRMNGTGLKTGTRAYLGANQSIGTGAWTKVQLNTESFDSENNFSNYRFTAKIKGYYFVKVKTQFDNISVAANYKVAIYKNGVKFSEFWGIGVVAGDDETFAHSDIVDLDTNDYVEFYVYHDVGANRDIIAGSATTFMSIHQLSKQQ